MQSLCDLAFLAGTKRQCLWGNYQHFMIKSFAVCGEIFSESSKPGQMLEVDTLRLLLNRARWTVGRKQTLLIAGGFGFS
jgi:hypothetical protein